jgi:UDP-N-acetylglucosamine/UDP-N-acetylgalactosamine 4-epimerase
MKNGQNKRWLVTGAAGFIGFHLVDYLLKSNQVVIGVDNFVTGKRARLDYLAKINSPAVLKNFEFVEGDLQDLKLCQRLCAQTDYVLHQAALGSVPRSIANPLNTHNHNVNVFLNMLLAAKDAGVGRFVYASSSSVYGDNLTLPKKEENIGRALSPYAVTKQIAEMYAHVFQKNYGIETIGLRYFNVYGPVQDPSGTYAAVIPLWIRSLLRNEPVAIYGDGTISRDFCFVGNVVDANILAAQSPAASTNKVYNVACGDRTSLNDLFSVLRDECAQIVPDLKISEPKYLAPRNGDILHSLADIELAAQNLGYKPKVRVPAGLKQTVEWFAKNLQLFDS